MSIFIILYCVKVNVLSTVIRIQEKRPSVDMTEFKFVVPKVVIKYREKLLTQLIMSLENEVRENVY
ncbi:hypothetical protein PVL29_013758 [Vitis rotundifolia]|uniref:Uncharacterized protein n=1 Tax=Vitis rotundifolia TaxID=103349 RepID=A0AA38ZM70_VITRO|nr:hypothetical protein PVL29_013758 [Vitis rotundifolia]